MFGKGVDVVGINGVGESQANFVRKLEAPFYRVFFVPVPPPTEPLDPRLCLNGIKLRKSVLFSNA